METVCNDIERLVKEWNNDATVEIVGSFRKGTMLEGHREVDMAIIVTHQLDANILCECAESLFNFLQSRNLTGTLSDNWIRIHIQGFIADLVIVSDNWESDRAMVGVSEKNAAILRLSAAVKQAQLIARLQGLMKNLIIKLKQWRDTVDWGSEVPPSSYLLEIIVYYSKGNVLEWIQTLHDHPTILDPCDMTNNLCPDNWGVIVEKLKHFA